MSYQLTKIAAQDIEDIYGYSFHEFGENKADHYHEKLHDCFTNISENTNIGRDFGHIKPSVRRFLCSSHAIYYQVSHPDVLILRVLHQRMDPARHLIN